MDKLTLGVGMRSHRQRAALAAGRVGSPSARSVEVIAETMYPKDLVGLVEGLVDLARWLGVHCKAEGLDSKYDEVKERVKQYERVLSKY